MDGNAPEVSGIKADGYTLTVELSTPFGPFLGLLAMPGAYVVPKEEVEKWGEDFSDHAAGTGPYRLEAWDMAAPAPIGNSSGETAHQA
jgi:ABC-type oligopeptide transport system substrate-binding subunit